MVGDDGGSCHVASTCHDVILWPALYQTTLYNSTLRGTLEDNFIWKYLDFVIFKFRTLSEEQMGVKNDYQGFHTTPQLQS